MVTTGVVTNGLAAVAGPVGVIGVVGPKPVAKALSVSPGPAGRAAVTGTLLSVKTEATPLPGGFVKNAGAYGTRVMLNGAEAAPFTVTVSVVAPLETSTG